MSLVTHPPALAAPRGPALALAALGPVAVGAILAARVGTPMPMIVVPAILFGVVAATSPALYIATAATGSAPSLAGVLRAFGIAFGAFGIALAGLLLPMTFLSLSSLDPMTTVLVASGALGGAGVLALRRLGRELDAGSVKATLGGGVVFVVWAFATVGIAGRLWWDLAKQVTS